MKKIRKYAALMIAGAVVLGSCGSDKKTESTSAATTATTAAPTATTGASTATTAAATDTTAAAGDVIDCKPIKPGVLSVVTSLPGPNFWGTSNDEVDPDSIKSGIEFDLANDLAAKCGLKMEFRNEGFDAIVAGQIAADSYDIALSQVTITEERAKVVDFSVGYFKSDQGLLVKAGTKVASWDDVKKLKIGVQASTTAEYYFTSGEVPGWTLEGVKSYPDLSSAYAALNAGQIDGVVIDTPINLGQASTSGGKLEVVGQFKTGEEYGAIFGKGNGKKEIFDPIMQGLIDDGTVNALIAKYLGGDPSTVPFIDVPSS
jgi:polar amino acid transport system substrate-binding protein